MEWSPLDSVAESECSKEDVKGAGDVRSLTKDDPKAATLLSSVNATLATQFPMGIPFYVLQI